eukprot:1096546-Rhodomonas_salina.1
MALLTTEVRLPNTGRCTTHTVLHAPYAHTVHRVTHSLCTPTHRVTHSLCSQCTLTAASTAAAHPPPSVCTPTHDCHRSRVSGLGSRV